MHSTPAPEARPGRSRRRVDVRRRALATTALAILLIGTLLAWDAPQTRTPLRPPLRFADVLIVRPPHALRAGTATMQAVRTRFEQGVMMLHMRQYEFALTAFHEVLRLAPELPEAHVNMGFALIGLEQWASARDFFETAIELRRDQINAYYGLAVALEAQGDRAGAIGAMQTYLHRAPADDAFRDRAESALWEWRSAGNGDAPLPTANPATPTTQR